MSSSNESEDLDLFSSIDDENWKPNLYQAVHGAGYYCTWVFLLVVKALTSGFTTAKQEAETNEIDN